MSTAPTLTHRMSKYSENNLTALDVQRRCLLTESCGVSGSFQPMNCAVEIAGASQYMSAYFIQHNKLRHSMLQVFSLWNWKSALHIAAPGLPE